MPTLCSPFASEPNVGGAENPCIGGRAGAGGRLGEAMSRLSGGYPSAPRWSASPTPRAPRFRRSELAAVGRRELLRWVNRTVGVDYVQVESCADGVALAQLIDAAYPDARVPLYRLDFATRHEHDRARNLEVVRATLDRLDLDVPLDVKEVSRGVYRACDEALRWLYLVVQRERPPSATRGYDGRARRLEALQKRGYLARAPSKSPGWRSAASWDERGSGGDPSCASPSAAATPSAYAYDPATPYATPSSSDAGSDAAAGGGESADRSRSERASTGSLRLSRRRAVRRREKKTTRGRRRRRRFPSGTEPRRARSEPPPRDKRASSSRARFPPPFGPRQHPPPAAARPSPSSRARAWTYRRSAVRGNPSARRRPGTKKKTVRDPPRSSRATRRTRHRRSRRVSTRRAGRWTSGRRRRA